MKTRTKYPPLPPPTPPTATTPHALSTPEIPECHSQQPWNSRTPRPPSTPDPTQHLPWHISQEDLGEDGWMCRKLALSPGVDFFWLSIDWRSRLQMGKVIVWHVSVASGSPYSNVILRRLRGFSGAWEKCEKCVCWNDEELPCGFWPLISPFMHEWGDYVCFHDQ